MRIIKGIFCLALLGPSILVLNLFQVFSLVLLPFSIKANRVVNRVACGMWFGLLNFCLFRIMKIDFVITGDSSVPIENAFIIANHQSMIDIPAIISFAAKNKKQQDLKWYVKDPIKWVPGIGWGMLFLDCIFVKRNWAADKNNVLKIFSRLRENNVPYWLVSFVEGTRLTRAKKKRSQEFAARQNLPFLNYVMIPRSKGFTATLDGLGSTTSAVYDITIGYKEGREHSIPHLMALFFKKVSPIHVNVKRFTLAQIGQDREAWLLDRFVQKDKLLASFYESGFFR